MTNKQDDLGKGTDMTLNNIGLQNVNGNWKSWRPGTGAPISDSAPVDGYAGTAAVKLPGQPTFGKPPGHKRSLLTSKAVTLFVTAATIGSLFMGMAAPAFAADAPAEKPVATQVLKQEEASHQAGQRLRHFVQNVRTRAAETGRQIGHRAAEAGRQVSEQATETAPQVAEQAAEQAADQARQVIEQAKPTAERAHQVGKELGQAGKEIGQGIARNAVSFWNGVRGK